MRPQSICRPLCHVKNGAAVSVFAVFVDIPGDRAAKSPEQSKLSPLLLELLLRGLGDQGSPTKEGMEWSETRNTGM